MQIILSTNNLKKLTKNKNNTIKKKFTKSEKRKDLHLNMSITQTDREQDNKSE